MGHKLVKPYHIFERKRASRFAKLAARKLL